MMGASHIAAVYARWGHLPDRPFRLLTHMALVPKDETPKPTYWKGRDALAYALGYADPASPTARKAVKRCLRELRDAGAIRIVYRGHAGKNTEYEVILTGKRALPTPEIEADRGDDRDPPKAETGGTQMTPHRGDISDPKGGSNLSKRGDANVPPEEHKEHQERGQEQISSTKVSTEGAVAGDGKDGDLSPMAARRIIRDYVGDDVQLRDRLRAKAPIGLADGDRTLWLARHIIAIKEQSA